MRCVFDISKKDRANFQERKHYVFLYTVESRYNEPRGGIENSSLYREFVI